MDRRDRFRLRVVQIPPPAWAGVMVVAVLALGLAVSSIDAVARIDAAAVGPVS